MRDVLDLTLPELSDYMNACGEKAYRARQVYSWIYKGAKGFEDMSDIPKTLRARLSGDFEFRPLRAEKKIISENGAAIKYLFELYDNNLIETVVMRYNFGISVCVSTQVGCRMGCAFCASTKSGMVRNLTAGEMMAQVRAAGEGAGERVSNIVLMGSGEPLDNYENVLSFIRNCINENGLGLGARHITLSTCGIYDKIYELADEGIPITLSVSLHAPDDETRKSLMPAARAVSMEKLFSACGYYIEKTARRITFEYALIKGINDSEKAAISLSEKLSGMLCHVNLIPMNPIKGGEFERSPARDVEIFFKTLKRAGIAVTVRRVMGDDINAACGQLRGSHL